MSINRRLAVFQGIRRIPMVLAILSLPATACFGQATMPAGWEQMSAQDFVNAAQDLFAATPGPTAEHARAVIEHGWATFLNNEQFISQAQGSTLSQMVRVISARRAQRVDADTITQQVTSDLETLHTRVAARIAAEPALISPTTYQDVVDTFFFQYNANVPHPQRIEPIGAWVAANNWQSLTLRQQSWLYWYLNTADKLDPQKFSVRWTGSIAAPTTDQYTFSQLRQYYIDGALKVWIDNQLILDSTAAVTRTQGEGAPEVQEPPGPEDARFQSQPVRLTAGQPVEFRAELVFDRAQLRRHNIFPERMFPMAVLVWEAPSTPKQIIAQEAFAPPAGFGQAGARGLKGEYFSDAGLSQAAGTFLDPGLQWIWNEGAVLSIYRESQDAILANCREQLIQEANLAAIPQASRAAFANETLRQFLVGLTARQRTQVMSRLNGHPEILKVTNDATVAAILHHTFMLPAELRLNVLVSWCLEHEPAPTEIAHYPGEDQEGYVARNYDSFKKLADWLTGPQAVDAIRLLDIGLGKRDGGCNLALVQLLAQTSRDWHPMAHPDLIAPNSARRPMGRFRQDEPMLRNLASELRAKLDAQLSDEALTGDSRVQWLLARAYVAENASSTIPNPLLAIPYLEQAELVADSTTWRFRVKQELIARLISIDRSNEAQPLLQASQRAFTSPEQRALVADWQAKAKEYPVYYEAYRIRSAAQQASTSRRLYLEELDRRRQTALQRNNTAEAQRYRARLERAGYEFEDK